jgi:hypothetical protein
VNLPATLTGIDAKVKSMEPDRVRFPSLWRIWRNCGWKYKFQGIASVQPLRGLRCHIDCSGAQARSEREDRQPGAEKPYHPLSV